MSGTPIGSPEFVQRKLDEKLADGKALLEEVVQTQDPQEAWQLLARCVVPRINHTLRTLAPALAQQHAEDWDSVV